MEHALRSVLSKTQSLIRKYLELREERDLLKLRVSKLEHQLHEQSETIEVLKSERSESLLSDSITAISSPEEQKAMRKKVTEMIQDIDKCILLLEQEN